MMLSQWLRYYIYICFINTSYGTCGQTTTISPYLTGKGTSERESHPTAFTSSW